MSINLRILTPEETTNYILNPEMRYGTDGWTLKGSTISRTLDYARFGIASLKVITAGSVLNEGAYYRVSSLQGVNDVVTVSAYVRGEGKVRIRVYETLTSNETASQPINLTLDRWQRIEVTGRNSGVAGGNDIRLYVETADTIARAITFYIDGAQMELKPYATTFCDGDIPGCLWNITNSASISTRTGDTRQGGRWVPLAGPCSENNDLYVTVLGGMGAAPITNQIQSFALAPGSFYQGTKVQNRVVTFSFNAKNENLTNNNPSLKRLHELRQQLIDLVKPDKTIGGESFLIEYSDTEGDRALYCNFRYEAGLEGEWDIRNGWYDSFPLRLLAVDPYWFEDSQDVTQLGIKQESLIGKYVKKNNIWQDDTIGLGPTGLTTGFVVQSPTGALYGTASATNTLFRYDSGTSTTLLGTVAGGTSQINDGCIGLDGNLYIGGNFTSVNGVAANRVAKLNLTTGVWSALGTGVAANIVYAMYWAKNNQLYIGGTFTSVGGINCYYVARWDGFQWRTVGSTSGLSGNVLCITPSNDGGTLYIGGDFLTSNGGSVTYNGVAAIDISTNLLSQVGYGFVLSGGLLVYALEVGKDGTLYAGGSFTSEASPGTNSLNAIGMWKGGNRWLPLDDGLTGNFIGVGTTYVDTILASQDGSIYVGGNFTTSGDISMVCLGKWNTNTWVPPEVENKGTPGGSGVIGIKEFNGNIYVRSTSNLSYFPYANTVSNKGTSETYPIMYIKGQGTIRYIENAKTGQGIHLDLAVFANEEVFIDFAKGEINSLSRGSLLYTIIPGSEMRAVKILPDDNVFSILIVDDVNCVAQLRYVPRHSSADAIVDSESL